MLGIFGVFGVFGGFGVDGGSFVATDILFRLPGGLPTGRLICVSFAAPSVVLSVLSVELPVFTSFFASFFVLFVFFLFI